MSDEDGSDPFEELADIEGEDIENPFAELAAEAGNSEAGGAGVFDEAGAPGMEGDDFESLWAQLEEGASDPDAGTVDVEEDASVDVVSKRSFCERCQYFSEPPEVRCTHEGTEILEFVDSETVRLKNCPIVAGRRRSGKLE